jgi:hypothetical protein
MPWRNNPDGTFTKLTVEEYMREQQPTEHEDEFNEILAAAYAALMQMPVKPETYEQFVKAEMLDHQYKEPRYRRPK